MIRDLYVFLHLPKTAGSTLGANLWRNFKRDEWLPVWPDIDDRRLDDVMRAVEAEVAQHKTENTRCAFGHWAYWGLHRLIRPECTPRHITFLREPVERGISVYGYVKSRPQNRWHRSLMECNYSLANWIQDETVFELHNAQTRRLLFDGTDDVLTCALTAKHMEAAKQRLREYWFVGLTEAFDADSLYLYGKLNFRSFHRDRVINATPDKPTVSPEERYALRQANLFDIELYEFASHLRSQWMRDHAAEVRFQQRKSRLFQSLYEKRCAFRRMRKPQEVIAS